MPKLANDAMTRRRQRVLEEAAGVPPGTLDQPSTTRQLVNVVTNTAHAAVSITKTTMGISRATDEQINARLNICRACPGSHAVWRDGDVYTCGPMLEGLRRSGQSPCGCVLRLKASDTTENCPFGWWPPLDDPT